MVLAATSCCSWDLESLAWHWGPGPQSAALHCAGLLRLVQPAGNCNITSRVPRHQCLTFHTCLFLVCISFTIRLIFMVWLANWFLHQEECFTFRKCSALVLSGKHSHHHQMFDLIKIKWHWKEMPTLNWKKWRNMDILVDNHTFSSPVFCNLCF